MKIKDLITKLKQFDPELEVIIMDYDGFKEKGEKNIDLEIQESPRMWGDYYLEKALVIKSI